ncbi:sortase A [Agrococcus sp. UYP33]
MPRMRRTRRATRGALGVVALLVSGACIMLYPATAAWFAELRQSQLLGDYATVVEHTDGAAQRAALASAQAYNETLTGGAIVEPDLERASDTTGEAAADYRAQLAGDEHEVMARVRVPAIGVDLPIYHGTSEEVLRRGVGHLFGTALPVGGADTHAVITGHRGLPESTLFTNLDQVGVGDLVQIDVAGELLTYRVSATRVVEPSDTHSLFPVPGQDLLTLITCTPLGINSHRILVTAERIPNPSADDPLLEMPPIPGLPWWSVGLAAALGAAAAIVTTSSRPRDEVARERRQLVHAELP